MNRLQYIRAKLCRDEAAFVALSCSEANLFATLRGKRVALVGNARALASQSRGAEIDAADLVIRINAAPRPSALSHGVRTDWLALAVRQNEAQLRALGNPRVLWLSPKLKRISFAVARRPGFFRYPRARYDALAAMLGTGPTTGAMMIDLLSGSPMTALRLYGFDFFASLSLSGPRTTADVGHNFDGEAGYVRDLCARDPRVVLIPTTG